MRSASWSASADPEVRGLSTRRGADTALGLAQPPPQLPRFSHPVIPGLDGSDLTLDAALFNAAGAGS
jgi:hypothetical protein